MSSKGVRSSTKADKPKKTPWYPESDPIFNKKNHQRFLKEDPYWRDELKFQVLKHKARAAAVGPVLVYENYIPLYRLTKDEDCFAMAEANTLYVWNWKDKSEKIVDLWAAKVKKAHPDKKIEIIYDPGGA